MSNLVKIDSNLLSNDIKRMDDVTKKLRDLFAEINNETESLKHVWTTKTSDGVYMDLEDFYKLAEEIANVNNNDARFLENVVNANYTNFEDKTGNLIDTNIAI